MHRVRRFKARAENRRPVQGDLGDVQQRESCCSTKDRRGWKRILIPAARTRHASASFPKDRQVAVAPRKVAVDGWYIAGVKTSKPFALCASTNAEWLWEEFRKWSSRGMGVMTHAELQCGCRLIKVSNPERSRASQGLRNRDAIRTEFGGQAFLVRALTRNCC